MARRARLLELQDELLKLQRRLKHIGSSTGSINAGDLLDAANQIRSIESQLLAESLKNTGPF